MSLRHSLLVCSLLGALGPVYGQDTPSEINMPSEQELQTESEAYLRDELGVNDVTTPSIAQIFKDLDGFQPIAFDVIAQNPRGATFDNRLQTSLHLGALVADGFVLTIAERQGEVQDIGRALIRQSRALGISDPMTKRSKSLLEYADKGDWRGMREELIRAQADVEKSMLDLRDEQMAHMISLGGWIRGYQLAANSCATNYSADRAKVLARFEIMDYYIDRLDTLHPRLKKTEFVSTITTKLKTLRELAASAATRGPTQKDVQEMRTLANEIETIILGPVDDDGRIGTHPAPENT